MICGPQALNEILLFRECPLGKRQIGFDPFFIALPTKSSPGEVRYQAFERRFVIEPRILKLLIVQPRKELIPKLPSGRMRINSLNRDLAKTNSLKSLPLQILPIVDQISAPGNSSIFRSADIRF